MRRFYRYRLFAYVRHVQPISRNQRNFCGKVVFYRRADFVLDLDIAGDFFRWQHLTQFRNIGRPEFGFRLFDGHKFCR